MPYFQPGQLAVSLRSGMNLFTWNQKSCVKINKFECNLQELAMIKKNKITIAIFILMSASSISCSTKTSIETEIGSLAEFGDKYFFPFFLIDQLHSMMTHWQNRSSKSLSTVVLMKKIKKRSILREENRFFGFSNDKNGKKGISISLHFLLENKKTAK